MNSEQVLLVVAAVGVLFFVVMGAFGSKRSGKARVSQRDAYGNAAHAETPRVNRAQRRKKR